MKPGDAYVDPLIARGEELEAIARGNGQPGLSPDEVGELASLKVYAATKLRHTTQFPLADSSQEESAQYLAQQEARSAHEREQAALALLRRFLALLQPIALAALQGVLARGLERMEPHVPHELRGVVSVVETAAMDAGATMAADVTG